MTKQEEFRKLLDRDRDNDLLDFFRNLSEQEKKEFSADLKVICKEYLDFKEVNRGGLRTFKRKASDKQLRMLNHAAFICFNRKDFEKTATFWALDGGLIDRILEWYQPKWLNEYINGLAFTNLTPNFFNYDWLLKYADKGLISPTPELIVKVLPAALFETTPTFQSYVRPEHLTRHALTLKEHIWYLFEHENDAYLSGRHLRFADGATAGDHPWLQVLKEFSAAGKIDRQKLLTESLRATVKNFNKTQSGWYAQLFEELEPSVPELLSLQQELLHALNSPHSKPLNTALNALRKISEEKDFDFEAFTDTVPVLLSRETKSVVATALSILEKLAKQYPAHRETICMTMSQAFVIQDDAIQTRIAKALVKYGAAWIQSGEALASYHDYLLVNARKTLQPLTGDIVVATPETRSVPADDPMSTALPAVDEISTVDELIFLASQAFDNNQPYHLDLLPAALIKWHPQLRQEDALKLEPALQRALKLVMEGGNASTGQLDQLLAIFFIDYARFLVSSVNGAGTLASLRDAFEAKDQEQKKKWSWYNRRIQPLSEWSAANARDLYKPHKHLLLTALQKIRSGDRLPLLSTPTHEPCFIAPDILVARLLLYEQQAKAPDPLDLEIAVSRCRVTMPCPDSVVDALAAGELRDLVRFLLRNESATPDPRSPFRAAWLAAGVTKDAAAFGEMHKTLSDLPLNHLTGNFQWKAFEEPHMVQRYNAEKRRYEKVRQRRKVLRLATGEGPRAESGLMQFFARFIPFRLIAKASTGKSLSLYNHLQFRLRFVGSEDNDIARLIYLIPNNPGPLLARVVDCSMNLSSGAEGGHQRLIAKAIEALVPLDVRHGEAGHLFIATSMLNADKTVQSFAAELWIKNAPSGNLDSERIGQIIGTQEAIELAPLKRFTDLASSTLLNVSAEHNRLLQAMIGEIIIRLAAEPITNLKKLLEIYYELLALNEAAPSAEIITAIQRWNSSATLKKIIGSIAAIEPLPQANLRS